MAKLPLKKGHLGEGTDQNLRIPTLGELVSLGTLYDARTSSFLSPMKPWSQETIRSMTGSQKLYQPDVSTETDLSFAHNASLLGLTPMMQLSFLSSKLKAVGSGRYLYDSKAYNTVSLTVSFKIFTRLEELTISPDVERHKLKESPAATHAVTRVWYGARAFIVLYKEKREHEEEAVVMAELERAAKELKSAFISRDTLPEYSAVDPAQNQPQWESRSDYLSIKCRYYGDIQSELPINFNEALTCIGKLSLESSDFPVQVELVPLSRILGDKACVWKRKFSDEMITEAVDYCQTLNEVIISTEAVAQQISHAWQRHKESLLESAKHFKSVKLKFLTELFKLLPEAWEKSKGSGKILELISGYRDYSPFARKYLQEWIKVNERQCGILQAYSAKLQSAGVRTLGSTAEKSHFDFEFVVLFEVSFSKSTYQKVIERFLQDDTFSQLKDFSVDSWSETPEHCLLDEAVRSILDLRNSGAPVNIFWLSEAGDTERPIQVRKFGRKGKDWIPWVPPEAPCEVVCFKIDQTQAELHWKPVNYDFTALVSYQIDLLITDCKKLLRNTIAFEPRIDLLSLMPGTEYEVQVRTLTHLGSSQPTAFVKFKTSNLKCPCSTFVRDNVCEKEPIMKSVEEKFLGDIYQLKKQLIDPPDPCRCLSSDDCLCPRSFEVGVNTGSCNQAKFMLILGETGSGKTTFINAIANAFYRVKYGDNFRFKLINEVSQVYSQTTAVSVYTLFPVRTEENCEDCSTAMDCPLTIIDTPGFCDTRGDDKQVVKKIARVLSDDKSRIPGMTGVLHAIGLVVRESQNKLTKSQIEVFNQVLSFFGSDVKNIVYPILTFADISDEPQALGPLKEFKVPCDVYFTFDNKVLFADSTLARPGQERRLYAKLSLNEEKWQMTWSSYTNLFQELERSKAGISLQSTRDVLNNRKLLEEAKNIFVKRVHRCLITMTNLENELHLIQTLDAEINEVDMSKAYTSIVLTRETRQLAEGNWAMMCNVCELICHEPCDCSSRGIPSFFRKCNAFSPMFGRCNMCSQRCSSEVHEKVNFYYDYVIEEKPVSVKNVFERLEKNIETRRDKDQVVQGLKDALKKESEELKKDLAKIHWCLKELERMALRTFPLTVGKYVDLMIRQQKMKQERGWEKRVRFLEESRESAGVPEVQSFVQDLEMYSIELQ